MIPRFIERKKNSDYNELNKKRTIQFGEVVTNLFDL